MEKVLGKINSVRIGFGGYQDAMFGASFDLGGSGWGVGDWKGPWAHWDKHCKWTKEDQAKQWADTMLFLLKLCKEAKVTSVNQLKGIPIEAEFKDNTLKSWRILKEVI